MSDEHAISGCLHLCLDSNAVCCECNEDRTAHLSRLANGIYGISIDGGDR